MCGYCHDAATYYCPKSDCEGTRTTVCKSCGMTNWFCCSGCGSTMIEEEDLPKRKY